MRPATSRAPFPRVFRGLAAILVLLTAGPALSWAEPLTLDQCIEIALRNNPSLRAARAGVDADRAGHLSTYSAFLPSLSASWDYSRRTSWREDLTDITATDPNDPSTWEYHYRSVKGTSDGYSASYTLSQNLITPAEWLQHRASAQSLIASQSGLRSVESDIRYLVRLQYFAFLQAILLDEVYVEATDVARAQLNRSQALFDLGSVARTDVLQARVNLASAERSQINARNAIEEERARLAVLLGMDVTEPLEIRRDITDPASFEENENALISEAQASRPELRQAQAAQRAAKLQSKSAFWSMLPSLGGSASYQKGLDDLWDTVNPADIDQPNASWGIGIGVNWRVFDGLSSIGNYKRAKASVVAASESVRRQELEASLAVRQAQVAVKNAREGIDAATESVALAEENLRLQQALYDNGGGTILEVNNAQAELTRARNDLVNARISLHMALAQQERAIGR